MDVLLIVKIPIELNGLNQHLKRNNIEAHGAYPGGLSNSKRAAINKPKCILQHAIVSTSEHKRYIMISLMYCNYPNITLMNA